MEERHQIELLKMEHAEELAAYIVLAIQDSQAEDLGIYFNDAVAKRKRIQDLYEGKAERVRHLYTSSPEEFRGEHLPQPTGLGSVDGLFRDKARFVIADERGYVCKLTASMEEAVGIRRLGKVFSDMETMINSGVSVRIVGPIAQLSLPQCAEFLIVEDARATEMAIKGKRRSEDA